MEHALPPAGHPGHPWRTIAVVAAGIATLELLGLVLVGVTLLAKPVVHRARADALEHTTPASTKTKLRPPLPRRKVTVTVLNGNGLAGAAAAEASRVRARGYRIRQVGNAPRSGYGQSVVMYRSGRRPEALRFARDLHVGIVSPLDGLRARDLKGAQVAVVVGG